MLTSLLLAAAVIAGVPVPEPELATMRGGVALPNGLNVAIAIQTDTRVDGALLLRSVYRVDNGAPMLAVYAPEAGSETRAPSTATAAGSVPTGLTVRFDRQNGTQFSALAGATPIVTISRGSATAGTDASSTPIALSPDGAAVAVPGGSLSLGALPNGQRVNLVGDGIEVSHLVGNAIGSIISNSGNDRVIDSSTTLGLDISGATAANLGSSMLRVDTLVGDATAAMLPR